MKFTKMQGAGNDFIILNNIDEQLDMESMSEIAKKLCERRISLGADGLMVADKPEGEGDFRMRFYNADGSMGEMCGNGARCICCYGYEHGLSGEIQKVETPAGMVTGKRFGEREYEIRLNDLSVMELGRQVEIDGMPYTVDYIELGKPGLPHGAVEIEGLSSMDKEALRELGKKLRYCDSFPKGINVNFYELTGEDEISELTYERGVEDFTLACGSGTGSVCAALTARNRVSGKNVRVHVPGGILSVTIENPSVPSENIYLRGPVKIVAEGTICDI